MKLKTIRIALYVTIVLLTVTSVIMSEYESQYLLPYVTILGPIIGVIISSLIALEIWRLRLQDDYIKDHLNTIKIQCLKPLKEVISERSGYFTFSEEPIDVARLESVLGDKLHWYDKQGIDLNMGLGILNLKLHKDLDNHKLTKGLPDAFVKIKRLISDNYPIFLRKEIDLYQKIDGDKEFNEMIRKRMKDIEEEKEREGFYSPPEPEPETAEEVEEATERWQEARNRAARPFAQAIFLIATGEGDNTRMWPNIYRNLAEDAYLGQVYSMGERYKNSVEAKNLVEARNTVQSVVAETIGKINEVLEDSVTLEDKCPIIKENLKNY